MALTSAGCVHVYDIRSRTLSAIMNNFNTAQNSSDNVHILQSSHLMCCLFS